MLESKQEDTKFPLSKRSFWCDCMVILKIGAKSLNFRSDKPIEKHRCYLIKNVIGLDNYKN